MKNDLDDQQIISDYLNGNEESLKMLIQKNLRPIYNFAYRFCNNTEDAEDITQEVFVKIWKNLKKYKPTQNFRVWIFIIARNTAIDRLRKRKNLVFSDFDNEDGNFMENTITDSEPTPDELVIMAEDKKILSEKISKLSPIYQTILAMRYTEDFSFKEIAEITGKPIETLKSQHRRALIQLKKLFKP